MSDGETDLRFDRDEARAEFETVLQGSDKDLIVTTD